MIFSTFFKSNWQHKKANIRLTAIANELSLDNPEHRTILTNMAKQDTSDNVRKSALLKLNDIELYIEILNQPQSNDRSFVQLQIESLLLANNNAVTTAIKTPLIELLTKSFLEQWLVHENNVDIAKALHQKINKPQHIVNGFNKTFTDESMTESFQLFLLSNVNDIALLEKLTKKTTIEPVKKYIGTQIAELVSAKEKPIQVTKSTQLVLSKLLALKESKLEYTELLNRRDALQREWQASQNDFSYILTEQQTTFSDKYTKINQQLDKIFAPKKEQYLQAEIANKLITEKYSSKQKFNDIIKTLEQALANAVFENNDLTSTDFETQLNELPQLILLSPLNTAEQKIYNDNVILLQKKLQQLPVIAKSVTDATHLISKISQLALPIDMEEMAERSVIFYDWLEQWKTIEKQSIGELPDSIKNAKNEIVNQWQAGLAPFNQQQKQIFNQAKKYLIDIKRLIAKGKFNPCFGLYKKLKAEFCLLSTNQQYKLQREFDQISEKLNELSDWESYIATPKKQELLEHIKTLVNKPLDNPNDQANKVKLYRKQWNSLGHAEDELEKQLNDEFNLLCEQAFAPCREFYAQQDSLRKQHADSRLRIIEKVEQLAAKLPDETCNDSNVFKTLDAELNKMNKAWREAGDVDKKQYNLLQRRYKSALLPIKNFTAEYQKHNAVLKQGLIDNAKVCLERENIFNAINEVKELQQQWRTIGYAGPKHDNELWQTFRTINDSVFTKRDQAKIEQENIQSSVKSQFEAQIENIKSHIDTLVTVSEYKEMLIQVQHLLKQVIINKPVIKVIANQLEQIIVQLELEIKEKDQLQKKQNWLDIFNVLTELANDLTVDELNNHVSFKQLSSFWQKKITEASKQTKMGDRVDKTLALEILGRIESPVEYSDERLAMQVRLLQQQMLSADGVDLKTLFIDWLLSGKFTNQDVSFINRIKPLYC